MWLVKWLSDKVFKSLSLQATLHTECRRFRRPSHWMPFAMDVPCTGGAVQRGAPDPPPAAGSHAQRSLAR